ncbi:O-antigen ligase family protein [Patescibacteria group bacterium]|nr:O-antigen ligase family protein [Patescibacteria group bacterium]
MVDWWGKIERALLWLVLIVLPWQMRVVLMPIFRSDIFIEYLSISLYLTDILVASLLIVWIVLMLLRRQKLILGQRLIFWSVVSFIGWIWVTLCLTKLTGVLINPIIGVWAASKITLFGLFYFYLINRVRSVTDIVMPLSIGIFLQGGIAIGQYFSNHSLGLKLLDESVLDPIDRGIPVVIKNGIRQLRAHGLTPHANVLGGYLAVGLLLLKTELLRKNNYWLWVSFLLGMTGLFLSFSRTAWLVFVIGSIIISWYSLRYKLVNPGRLLKGWAISLVLIAVLVVSQYQAVLPRITANQAIEQNSLTEREQQFEEFKDIYSGNEAFGVGIGQYLANNMELVDVISTNNDYPQPVHNMFLLVLAELGIMGLIFFGIVLIRGLIELWRTKPSLTKIAVISALMGVIILGLTDHYIWDLQQGKLVFWLVLALTTITGYNKEYGRR